MLKEMFEKKISGLQCHFNNVGVPSPEILFKRASSLNAFLQVFQN